MNLLRDVRMHFRSITIAAYAFTHTQNTGNPDNTRHRKILIERFLLYGEMIFWLVKAIYYGIIRLAIRCMCES